MGLFSSFRVVPGVRISASSRGLRAHVGPRFARVHVGGGRTGVSTGAGPFTAYQGLGTSSRTPRRTQSATNGMTPAQAERARQVAEVSHAWDTLESQHRVAFPAAQAPGPVAADPVPMFGVLLRDAEREELRGIGRFDRDARREARVRARGRAEEKAGWLLSEAAAKHAADQAASDAEWAALLDADPHAVTSRTADALARRGIRADVTSGTAGEVRVALEVPGVEAVPTHRPDVTPTGLPTLKKLTKTEASEAVRQVVTARVLLVAKEVLAESPATEAVTVAARFPGSADVLRATLRRDRLARAPWHLDAWNVLTEVDPAVAVNIGGRTQELRPLGR